jgi:transcriptional regulator with PAS, ATPase and Fis domain
LTEEIIIKIISDGEDNQAILNAVNQVKVLVGELCVTEKKQFDYGSDEVIVVNVSEVHQPLIREILLSRGKIKNKILFVFQGKDAFTVSSIAKAGFNDLYVFPHETYKFIKNLQEIILNKSYLINPVKPNFAPALYDLNSFIGSSKEFLRIINLSKKLAERKGIDILILGETGTGKGLLARSIHDYSSAETPFVDIICTAIPENLIESELFGYEPGAFTNAKHKKLGLMEMADNGTIFLDEIGDLGFGIQAKLLRVIERKLIRRLGGVADISINARIISATNRDLAAMVESNHFRRDLYHRLNVVTLEIPPLRERKEDLLPLCYHFINTFNTMFGKNIQDMAGDVVKFIHNYKWPGNIREFKNAIERAVLLSDGNTVLTLKHFASFLDEPFEIIPKIEDELPVLPEFIRLDLNYTETDLREINRLYAFKVLQKANGNKTKAAKLLNISRPKLDTLLSNKM